jgi:hypothetical protein
MSMEIVPRQRHRIGRTLRELPICAVYLLDVTTLTANGIDVCA